MFLFKEIHVAFKVNIWSVYAFPVNQTCVWATGMNTLVTAQNSLATTQNFLEMP